MALPLQLSQIEALMRWEIPRDQTKGKRSQLDDR